MTWELYIALYKLNKPYQRGGRTVLEPYHWGIAIPLKEQLNKDVSIYQIGSIEESDEEWVTSHNRSVVLTRSSTFLALVQLPNLKASRDQIIRLLDAESPSQDAFTVKPPGVWNCAQWVIRCLQRFQENDWFVTPPPGNVADQDSYYNFITVDKANRYAMAIQQDVSFEDYVGRLVNGVRVLDGFTPSGEVLARGGDLFLIVCK